MSTRTLMTAMLPLDATLSQDDVADLIAAIESITRIVPTKRSVGPCVLDYDIDVDTTSMPASAERCFDLIDGHLLMHGAMGDLDTCIRWIDGTAEYVSGTPLMTELMKLLSRAARAHTGVIVGSMRIEGGGDHAGPIIITDAGLRWCPSGTMTGQTPLGSTIRTVRGSIPRSMIVESIDRDPECHVDVDRRALRTHLEYEDMKRVHPCGAHRPSDDSAEAA